MADAAAAVSEDWYHMFGAKIAKPNDMNADKVRQITAKAKAVLADVSVCLSEARLSASQQQKQRREHSRADALGGLHPSAAGSCGTLMVGAFDPAWLVLTARTLMRSQVVPGADPEQRHSMELKKHCEDLFGDTWMTVIGRNFGCYCIHESKNFLFFYLGKHRRRARRALVSRMRSRTHASATLL